MQEKRKKGFYKKRILAGAVLILLVAACIFANLFIPRVRKVNSLEEAFAIKAEQQFVFVGGEAIGISAKPDGLMVQSLSPIITEYGAIFPKTEIEKGDIILEVNEQSVYFLEDVQRALEDYSGNCSPVLIEVLRGGKKRVVESLPVKEAYSGSYRLGVNLSEYAEGIGTITYTTECGKFASLGHPINSMGGTRVIPCSGGRIYDCKIIGNKKAKKGELGELKGVFVNQAVPIGQIQKNARLGVYGISTKKVCLDERIEVAGKKSVKKGKAKMITTIGEQKQEFDIKIIKISKQKSPSEKSFVVKIKDKRLLEATGGIVQGMSGSPIIQNGKLVGAITHVFTSDPTKGYGVFAEWMLENH